MTAIENHSHMNDETMLHEQAAVVWQHTNTPRNVWEKIKGIFTDGGNGG